MAEQLTPREFVKNVQKVKSKSIESPDVCDNTSKEDYGQFLFQRLISRLPEEFAKTINDDEWLAIGAVEDPIPNASMKKLNDYRYAILFNTGLRDFIYRVTRALSTCFVFDQQGKTEDTMDFRKTCQIIADIFWWYQETEQAFGPQYTISDERIRFATMLSMEAETFFLAHELGHVIIDLTHLENPEKTGLDPLDEELQADKFALGILLQRAKTEYPIPQDISYAAAELGLRIFAGLETTGLEFASTHPSATKRITAIRRLANSMCVDNTSYEGLTGLSKAFEELFEKIITTLKTGGEEHSQFYQRAASQVVEEMNQLLESCSVYNIPNYLTFYEKAPAIFNQGYSHRLLEEIAKVTREFLESLEKIDDEMTLNRNPVDKTYQHNLERFQRDFRKNKLLLGYIDQMNDPARVIFMKALTMGNNLH